MHHQCHVRIAELSLHGPGHHLEAGLSGRLGIHHDLIGVAGLHGDGNFHHGDAGHLRSDLILHMHARIRGLGSGVLDRPFDVEVLPVQDLGIVERSAIHDVAGVVIFP